MRSNGWGFQLVSHALIVHFSSFDLTSQKSVQSIFRWLMLKKQALATYDRISVWNVRIKMQSLAGTWLQNTQPKPEKIEQTNIYPRCLRCLLELWSTVYYSYCSDCFKRLQAYVCSPTAQLLRSRGSSLLRHQVLHFRDDRDLAEQIDLGFQLLGDSYDSS